MRTRHLAQTPTPPQELPRGAPARRATSSSVSSFLAEAARPSGVNDTTFDEVFTVIWQSKAELSTAESVYYSMRTTRAEGSHMVQYFDETRLAEEIVSILPTSVAREFSSERDTIRYAVRGEGMRLRTIVLNRGSLRRLMNDPSRDVKIEYLQRDILEAAPVRNEYRYPRPHLQPILSSRPYPFTLPFASMM
jgi:hypothetical protein